MQIKERESNIELCRIVCMLLIVAHHCVLHGGAIDMKPCVNRLIALVFYPCGKICFDTFIAISMYFLVDSTFKASRFMKIWLEVLFYSLCTTAAVLFAGGGLSVVQIASSFFPISGGVQGYAQTYLAFYLLIPLLSKVSKSMTKNQMVMILCVFVVFIFIVQAWQYLIWTEQSVYSRLGLFIFLYFLILYFKRNPIQLLQNQWVTGLTALSCYGFVFLQKYSTIIAETSIWRLAGPLVNGESALVNIIGGVSLFFFFKEIKLKCNHVINTFAGTTLAVLLLHDGHYSRSLTWELFRTKEWYYSKYFALYLIGCTTVIYILGTAIDLTRKKLLEEKLFQKPKVIAVFKRLDSMIKD